MGTTLPSTGSSEPQNISLQHGHYCLSRGMEYMAMTRPTKVHGHNKGAYRLQLWINTAHCVNGSSTAEDKRQNTMMAPVNQH